MKEVISLKREIFRDDVKKIINWLEDKEVIQYLNENQNINIQLKNLLKETNLEIFTHNFNQEGSFFLVTTSSQGPVGFIRLVPKENNQVEIITVIGERKLWGKGLGAKAIWEGLKYAFFNWRKNKVIANIHEENKRSKKVFQKVGFYKEQVLNSCIKYKITMDDFITHICSS